MSDDPWPEAGVGMSPHSPLSDGVPHGGTGPGSVKGPGLSASKRQTRNQMLYTAWRDAAEMATFGMASKVAVKPPVWNTNVKKLRKKLGEVYPNDTDQQIDARLREAFGLFCRDVKAKRLSVEGKDAWFVFMARHPKYIASSVQKAEKRTDGSWRDRMRKM